MEIQSLELRHFRNYYSQKIKFGAGQNILWGNNGEGKTSILEGIYLLALTKSFKTFFDRELIKSGETSSRIQGQFYDRAARTHDVEVFLELPFSKKIFLQGTEINNRIDFIGTIPIVCLSPDDHDITKGGPEERRRWMDLFISQANKKYLVDLVEYRKALKQRNKLLNEAHNRSNLNQDLIETWNELLVEKGTCLINVRRETVKKIAGLVNQFLKFILPASSESKIYYRPNVEESDKFRANLIDRIGEEITLHRTLTGPHRDEIEFELDGKQLRNYGSQGEHKIFLIALKCAEVVYLEEYLQEKPVLLLDDVFSELDTTRAKNLMIQIKNFGQTFITTTNITEIPIDSFKTPNWLKVEHGTISVQAA